MLQDAHSRKIAAAVSAPAGDTVVVPYTANQWHYIHEIIGDMSAAGTVSVVAINQSAAERILGTWTLADAQGLTLQDEPGEDNRPRFEFMPGEDAVLRTSGGTFIGGIHWSIRE